METALSTTDDNKPKAVAAPNGLPYIRVGNNFYEKCFQPLASGRFEERLLPLKKDTLKDDLRKEYGKDWISRFYDIPVYKGFVCIPQNYDYQEEIKGFKNKYTPLQHQLPEHPPEPESLSYSFMMIKHVFGDKWKIGLDYLALLYNKPTQPLPVLSLVSKENNTGKSTFLKWLKDIFGANMMISGQAELERDFNESYATQLIVAIDESFIDKQTVKENIKRMSTSDTISVNPKGRDVYEVQFFGKFILCSNNEEYFVRIDEQDERFFVLKVPRFKTEIVDMQRRLREEIPAFLFYLRYLHEMHTKQPLSRMWFHWQDLETPAFLKAARAGRSKLGRVIESYVRELFVELAYNPNETDFKPYGQEPGEYVLKFTAVALFRILQEEGLIQQSRHGRAEVQYCLESELRLSKAEKQKERYVYYHLKRQVVDFGGESEAVTETQPIRDQGRYFLFPIKRFFDEEELKNM